MSFSVFYVIPDYGLYLIFFTWTVHQSSLQFDGGTGDRPIECIIFIEREADSDTVGQFVFLWLEKALHSFTGQ